VCLSCLGLRTKARFTALADREHLVTGLEARTDQILCPSAGASTRKGICSVIGRGRAAGCSRKPGGRGQNLTRACSPPVGFAHSSADNPPARHCYCRNCGNWSSRKAGRYYRHFLRHRSSCSGTSDFAGL